MGVCLSCHRRTGRSSNKEKCDLHPLDERISECSVLPSEQKANTLPGEQRSEDSVFRTTNGTSKRNLPSFAENIDGDKLLICSNNGMCSIIPSNGHTTNLPTVQIKDNSCNSICDNIQSDLISVKTRVRDSMTMANMKSNLIKTLVSKQRIRFQDERFDLDLTYILNNIIAMGYPGERIEKFYRNSIDDVALFLELKHKDNYKIYNLCSEKSYDPAKFQNRVAEYPFDDHNPPTIALTKSFCDDVDQWLKASPDHVAVVHCKAGKGRTGTMISCYLLHSGRCETAAEALDFYGGKRTRDNKGVTIPSQRRYVEYYATFLSLAKVVPLSNSLDLYCPPFLSILNLLMTPPPILNGGQATLEFFVTKLVKSTMKKISLGTYEVKRNATNICMQLETCTPLVGDIKVEVYNIKSSVITKTKEKLFQLWFNTFFVAQGINATRKSNTDQDGLSSTIYRLSLTKWQIDEAHKDKQNKLFSSDFQVELTLEQVPEDSKWINESQQKCSPPSGSHSSSASEDSEDSLEESWESGGVVRGKADVLGRYRLLSEPDLEVEGGEQPATPSSRPHTNACPCPEVDSMLQA